MLEPRIKSCDSALPVKELSCSKHLLYARFYIQPFTFITLFNPHKSWVGPLYHQFTHRQTAAQTPDYISQHPLQLEVAIQLRSSQWNMSGRGTCCFQAWPIKTSHVSSSKLFSPSCWLKGSDPVGYLGRHILKKAKPPLPGSLNDCIEEGNSTNPPNIVS